MEHCYSKLGKHGKSEWHSIVKVTMNASGLLKAFKGFFMNFHLNFEFSKGHLTDVKRKSEDIEKVPDYRSYKEW